MECKIVYFLESDPNVEKFDASTGYLKIKISPYGRKIWEEAGRNNYDIASDRKGWSALPFLDVLRIFGKEYLPQQNRVLFGSLVVYPSEPEPIWRNIRHDKIYVRINDKGEELWKKYYGSRNEELKRDKNGWTILTLEKMLMIFGNSFNDQGLPIDPVIYVEK